MENLLKNIFDKALPSWIKENSILLSIRNTLSLFLSSFLNEYKLKSDFINSDIAKDFKQDDYSLYEYDMSYFKDKFKILFSRGSINVLDELSRIVRAETFILLDSTELFEDTPLDPTTVRLLLPNVVNSGFIMDITYPSINEISLEDYDNLADLQQLSDYFDSTDVILPQQYNGLDEQTLISNNYVFSEEVFLLLQLHNGSDFSNEELERIIRRELFPVCPVIIEYI